MRKYQNKRNNDEIVDTKSYYHIKEDSLNLPEQFFSYGKCPGVLIFFQQEIG